MTRVVIAILPLPPSPDAADTAISWNLWTELEVIVCNFVDWNARVGFHIDSGDSVCDPLGLDGKAKWRKESSARGKMFRLGTLKSTRPK